MIRLGDLDLADRFDAEYFQPAFLKLATALQGKGKQLKEIAKLSCSAFYPPATQLYEVGDVPFIRCVDVIAHPVIVGDQPFERVPTEFVEANRSIKTVKTGDIVITKVGSPCFAGIVHESLGHAALTRTVLGVSDINQQEADPYYLVAFLRSDYGFYQLMREREQQIQLQLTLDRVGRMNVYLPRFELQKEIGDMIRRYYSDWDKSKALYAEAEALLLHELSLDALDLSHELSYEATFGEALGANRLDAEYFQPKYRETVEHLCKSFSVELIGQLGRVLRGRNPSRYTDEGVPVIRSGDLADIDDLVEVKSADPQEHLFYLHMGDVCISSIGFGSIGKVQVFDKSGKFATVSEVTVIRQKRVNPYYLQIYLKSLGGQLQIERWITGATGQLHLYPRDVAKIAVPILPEEKQREFERIVMLSRDAKQQAKHLLEETKRRVEQMILRAAV